MIVDENFMYSDLVGNFIDSFTNHNRELIDGFIKQIYENGGNHRDVVTFGFILEQRLLTEFLFMAAQEAIKTHPSTKASNKGQIYEEK